MLKFLGSDMVLEQFHTGIFADRRCKQLAKICQRIMKVFGLADLLRIDNPADKYSLIDFGMLVEQAFEVHCVDQGSFTICNSVDLNGSLNEGKSRAGT